MYWMSEHCLAMEKPRNSFRIQIGNREIESRAEERHMDRECRQTDGGVEKLKKE